MNASARHELIMVMGVQRSGTTALFAALATDKTLAVFGENIDSEFYAHYRLRPVRELAPHIARTSRRILLKPIAETNRRSLAAVAEEFHEYALRFVWIYRDPVNVLHSMQREKWIGAADIAAPRHLHAWQKRNEHALRFQQEEPERIAIVRYEDLCLDPAVFRNLTAWLGLSCHSNFHIDTGLGRKSVPKTLQRAIDSETSRTLRALDVVRRFKPTVTLRWKRMSSHLRERTVQRRRLPDNNSKEPPGRMQPSCPPSAVPDLVFWLTPASFCQRNAPITAEIREIGPEGLVATKPENGPYGVLNLNLRGTLFFPPERVAERRRGESGTLVFGPTENFISSPGGFSLFALFRPNAPRDQVYATLFHAGTDRTELVLQWDGAAESCRAVLSRQDATVSVRKIVTTPPGSHRRKVWALAFLQYSKTEFSITVNEIAGEQVQLAPEFFSAVAAPGTFLLEVGGVAAAKQELYSGDLAEIIIYRRALSVDERMAVTNSLKATHAL